MANAPIKIKDYLICMQQIPPLSADDLKTAMQGRAQGDAWAGRLLEERFLPQVLAWVLPYRGQGLEFAELIEIGNRALLRALRQFKAGQEPDLADALERAVISEVEAALFQRR